jgi:hypothetical protein
VRPTVLTFTAVAEKRSRGEFDAVCAAAAMTPAISQTAPRRID